MAENKTTANDNTATSTGTDDVTTSTNEDTLDTDVPNDPDEDAAFLDGGIDETEEAEDLEEDESTNESEEESEEDVEQESEQSEGSSEDKQEESEEQSKDNSEMSDSERNRLYYEKRQAEKRAKATQEAMEAREIRRYLQEAEDDETELARRQLEVEAYGLQKQRIEVNESALISDYKRAIADIDLLRNPSPAVQEALDNAIDDFERQSIRVDESGRPVEVAGSLYEHLSKTADSIKKIRAEGETVAKKNLSKTRSKTAVSISQKPKERKSDDGLDAFDLEASRW